MDGKELGEMPVHGENTYDGITMRQHFAAMLLQGLLANPGGPVQASPISGTYYCNTDEDVVAHWAVSQADALLRELAKET